MDRGVDDMAPRLGRPQPGSTVEEEWIFNLSRGYRRDHSERTLFKDEKGSRKQGRKDIKEEQGRKDPPSIRNPTSEIESPIRIKSIFRNPIRIPQQRGTLVLVFDQFH